MGGPGLEWDVGAREGAVLRITLDRPERLNALTRPVLEALRAALAEAEDPEVRAVVITGAGRAFCVGQDLGEIADAPAAEVGRLLREGYEPVVRAIRGLEKPVLAALNGPAAGAGLSLCLACDVRVASEAAFLVPAFMGVGLVPDAGATHALARLLGAPRALEWLISGRQLSAAEAEAWGLVGEVVPEDRFAAVVDERARALAALPTRAVALTKRLLDAAPTATLEDQLGLESRLQEEAAGSADFAEGARAFLEKRPPRFLGR
jgi:2-(1,2-epoxy-1,2-dihydrophenyl)acetyl-CoA isomerase